MGATYSVGEVNHLYTFFVQWSPDLCGMDAKSFMVLNKCRLGVMEALFSNPGHKKWEIITVHEGKWEQKVYNSEGEESDGPEDLLPELTDQSELLDEFHLQELASHLPARTKGYPWRLVYSTVVHGTSLKTMYRNLAHLDRPVLLVIKDMDNQVFGAFASHPFKVSDCCYGTGETFLYSFSPNLKVVFHWTGENTYFVRGHWDSLQLGAGGGHFGLWLDSDLYRGSSFQCNTFHNQPLSSKQDFTIQDLEVWTFQSHDG
ncbi:nuclear receptor coactivator 7-like isoform X1 [Arapaima gigas]